MDIKQLSNLYVSMGSTKLFDESEHPRDADGKFGTGGGAPKKDDAEDPTAGTELPTTDALKDLDAKYPAVVPPKDAEDVFGAGMKSGGAAFETEEMNHRFEAAATYAAANDPRVHPSTFKDGDGKPMDPVARGHGGAATAGIILGQIGSLFSPVPGTGTALHALTGSATDESNANNLGKVRSGNWGELMEATSRSNQAERSAMIIDPKTGGEGKVEHISPTQVRVVTANSPRPLPNSDQHFTVVTTMVGTYRGEAYAREYPATNGWEFRPTHVQQVNYKSDATHDTANTLGAGTSTALAPAKDAIVAAVHHA